MSVLLSPPPFAKNEKPHVPLLQKASLPWTRSFSIIPGHIVQKIGCLPVTVPGEAMTTHMLLARLEVRQADLWSLQGQLEARMNTKISLFSLELRIATAACICRWNFHVGFHLNPPARATFASDANTPALRCESDRMHTDMCSNCSFTARGKCNSEASP